MAEAFIKGFVYIYSIGIFYSGVDLNSSDTFPRTSVSGTGCLSLSSHRVKFSSAGQVCVSS